MLVTVFALLTAPTPRRFSRLRLSPTTISGDRSTSFSHRTPVQPVPAVNVRKPLKDRFDDSDYEDDAEGTSHDLRMSLYP